MRSKKFIAISNKGFTIMELLIATTVFSVVLLICTAALLQIGKLYYRGVTEANTQEVARGVTDDISQMIQFSGATVYANHPVSSPTITNYCIGNKNYSFVTGKQLVDGSPAADQSNHVLVVQNLGGADCTSATPASFSGKELMSPNMRLAKFIICSPGDPVSASCPVPPPANSGIYQVNIRVVNGDSDLLCSPSLNDCNSNNMTNITQPDLACKSKAGFQFCAVSELSVTVEKSIK